MRNEEPGTKNQEPTVTDKGSGPPLLLIPGIQGRWEWMRPTVDALARRCRVVTFSLCGEPGAGRTTDRAMGFESFMHQIDEVLDRVGLAAAAVCGVSFGGLIALHYAATRPERTRALVLTSTPGPRWRPDRRVEWYVRAPRLLCPAFVLSSPFRLYPEIAAAFPHWRERLAFSVSHLVRVTMHPFAPTLMAERIRLIAGVDFAGDCARVASPTLVTTGADGLDRVVPVKSTCEYASRIRGARCISLDETGHIGLISRPDRYAAIVSAFVAEAEAAAGARRLA